MTYTKQKPDGYVAWHPLIGRDPMCITKTGCTEQLLNRHYGLKWSDSWAKAETWYAAIDAGLIKAQEDGWRIRPVKLVFLDEGEK